MTQTDEEKIVRLIDKMSEVKLEIPVEEIEIVAQREGIRSPRETIQKLEERGIISESEGKVTKIAKRLFW